MPARSRSLAPCFLAFAVATLGCTTPWEPRPAYPAGVASEYATAQTRGSLVVAIEPVLDAERSERAFGADLLRDEDLLAVLVAVHNRDASASRLLLPDAVSVAAAVPVASDVPDFEAAHPLSGAAGTAAQTALLIGGMGFPPLLIASLGYNAFAGHSVTQSRFRRHALLAASLGAHTVSPGEQVQGMVFFPLAKLRALGGPALLVVALTDPVSRAVERFEFAVDVPGERE